MFSGSNGLNGLVAQLRTFMSAEHNEQGGHANVTADTLALVGLPVGIVTNIAYSAARYTTDNPSRRWKVDAVDFNYLAYLLVGQLAVIWFSVAGSSFPDGSVSALRIALPELNLMPQYYNDGGGVTTTSLSFGNAELSDATSNAGGFVVAQFTSVGGSGLQVNIQRNNFGVFDGVDCDYKGFCVAAITPGNKVWTTYS